VRWQERNKPERIQLRPQNPKGPLKLLIQLVAGAGFDPATFGL
jgi:hypothetical protein